MDLLQTRFFTKKNNLNKLKKNTFRKKICLLIADMLENGFSFHEILQFLARLPKEEGQFGRIILEELEKGGSIVSSFEQAGFTRNLLLQLSLSQIHGDFSGTLKVMGENLALQEKQQQALKKILVYPVLLLGFVMVILLVLKFFLLPQLMASDMGDSSLLIFVNQLPNIILGSLLVGGLVAFFLKKIVGKKSALKQAEIYRKIPFLGEFYSLYITALFSREFGKLFKMGIDLKQVYEILSQEKNHPLMGEMAKKGQILATEGQELMTTLGSEKFFQKELSLMIQTGEMKGKLGDELLYFSDYLWGQLSEKIEGALKWIQPIIFLSIALVIVFLYAALLLPMYGNSLEGF